MLKKDASLRTVLITSPTYDGVCSDVRRIAEIVHQYDGILIVDEAHGAHFGMHPYFPEHALACGADLVINSGAQDAAVSDPDGASSCAGNARGPGTAEKVPRYVSDEQSKLCAHGRD